MAYQSFQNFGDDLYVAELSRNLSMPDDNDDEQDDNNIKETQVEETQVEENVRSRGRGRGRGRGVSRDVGEREEQNFAFPSFPFPLPPLSPNNSYVRLEDFSGSLGFSSSLAETKIFECVVFGICFLNFEESRYLRIKFQSQTYRISSSPPWEISKIVSKNGFQIL
ncbi:hypothetical protein RclHR1_02110001 [Rhizophagus clarus]|uniref:Uncharacterized protein n=1 Tax=Rhizophagus clarus TaxID=94130 RepID=A0A2Z6QX17_9GLOM|nr:hypothetical protein RclHR1_02110001 [Rhizophagus clarus]